MNLLLNIWKILSSCSARTETRITKIPLKNSIDYNASLYFTLIRPFAIVHTNLILFAYRQSWWSSRLPYACISFHPSARSHEPVISTSEGLPRRFQYTVVRRAGTADTNKKNGPKWMPNEKLLWARSCYGESITITISTITAAIFCVLIFIPATVAAKSSLYGVSIF